MPVGGLKEAYLSSKPLLFITLFTLLQSNINQYITVAVAIVFIFFYRVQKYEIFLNGEMFLHAPIAVERCF